MFKKIVIVEPIFMEKSKIKDLKDYCDELYNKYLEENKNDR